MWLLGSVVIGAALGWASERYALTRLGLLPAITTAIGGAVVASLILWMFGIGIYGRGVTAVAGAVVALMFARGARQR